jgi:hypothetical protein
MATKKPLARFWKALDEIPEATTDRREWSLRLGDDWPVAAVFLKTTGRLAKEITCPSPGGDGCPRKLVKHADGRFRAVCGNKPAECDPVDLTRDDVTCLTLDRAKLAAVVGAIFNVEAESTPLGDGAAIVVGSHGVAAGVGILIVLLIPGPMEIIAAETPTELAVGAGPIAIAVPTPRSIPKNLKATLAAQGHAILALTEITAVKDHRLVGIRPADELLAALREKLLRAQAPTTSGRAWLLPADARWEDLTFDFTADEVVNVQFGKETRRFEPEQFGLKNKKNGRPTSGWILLRSIARQGGGLTWTDRTASATIKKQKQLLSSRLRTLFGIEADPIPARGKAYQALFTIRDSTPQGAPARAGRR